jgi:predicted DNA-binding protein (UPF0251 family)
MKEEKLNLEYNTACLVVKAVNSSVNMDEAALKLGVHKNTLYELIRRFRIKMKRGSCHIKKQMVTYRNADDECFEDFPI